MSTSKLQKAVSNTLSIYLGEYIIRENVRPDWLITEQGERLELDFFIEELRVAIEVQGEQHVRFVPFFHADYSDFEKQKRYDSWKQEQCKFKEITLYEIYSSNEILKTIESITQGWVDWPIHEKVKEQDRIGFLQLQVLSVTRQKWYRKVKSITLRMQKTHPNNIRLLEHLKQKRSEWIEKSNLSRDERKRFTELLESDTDNDQLILFLLEKLDS